MKLPLMLRNGLKRFKERRMPICLECGTHVEYVQLLWNNATHRDERFCMKCAHAYRQEHPDCTPHGTVWDAPGGGNKEEKIVRPVRQFEHKEQMKCEMCDCVTINEEKLEGVTLCYGCLQKFRSIGSVADTGKRTFVAGKNGLVTLLPSKKDPTVMVERRWCCKCRTFRPKDAGSTIPNAQHAWWCDDCIEHEEGSLTNWHIRLFIKGKEENIEFFHWMMRRLDTDWEGDGLEEVCENCGGWEWKNPRMKPDQIKKLGKLAGLRKIKIIFWGKARVCKEKVIERAFKGKMLEGMAIE